MAGSRRRRPTRRTPMSDLGYAINDADNHYYEPDDCFTRHIEPAYKERTYWIDRSEPIVTVTRAPRATVLPLASSGTTLSQ